MSKRELWPLLALVLAACGAEAPAPQATGTSGPATASPTAAAPFPLRERAAELGIDFHHFSGATGKLYFSEMMGPGVGLLDADGDGDLDVLALQGSSLDGTPPEKSLFPPAANQLPLRTRLFRNRLAEDGKLRFEDATEASGLRVTGYANGVATGDIDSDGDVDLYLLVDGGNQLWRNDGRGHFEDVTATAGVGEKRWSAGAVFFDADRDGDLDLYVANYVDFTVATAKPCRALTGAPDYCGPLTHRPVADRFYRNRGDGTFEDQTEKAGFAAVAPGAGLGVVDGDWNGDGAPDLYVANDGMPNFLWQNRGDGTFLERGLEAGVSVNAAGQAEASMGIAIGDVDGDLDEDLLLTHLAQETNTFYRNLGQGFFEDATVPSGLGAPSLEMNGFGAVFFDLEGDGWLDLFTVNGTVKVQPARQAQGDPLPLEQRKQLFRNQGSGRFVEVRDPLLEKPEIGRGLAAGDLDNDGDTDLVVANNAGPLELLLNENQPQTQWLGLRLLSKNGSGALGEALGDALGAEVVMKLGNRSYHRRVRTGGSYSSAGDPRLLFGFGNTEAKNIEVEVRWPGGQKETFALPEIGRYIVLRQGESHAR